MNFAFLVTAYKYICDVKLVLTFVLYINHLEQSKPIKCQYNLNQKNKIS